MQHYASLTRPEIRNTFAAFCNARPVGQKFAHRATDIPAGSSSSMKWVNPPVAYMLHAGVPRLMAAGVQLPGLGSPSLGTTASARIALEGYPGLLARELLQQAGQSAGLNAKTRSYKNDAKALQTPERLIARKDMLTALEHGQTRLGLRLKLTHAQRDRLVDDATGDSLDAVLCLMQAAWAQQQHEDGKPRYGLPEAVDPLEGWIITA
jgi:predicted RNase H-like nuclease